MSGRRLLLTMGDPDGIGSEVSAKALGELGPQNGFQFIVFRSRRCPRRDLQRLDRKFHRVTLFEEDLPALLATKPDPKTILDVVSEKPAARWVESAARLCLKKQATGLVTAPLSKTGIAAAGLRDRGHTEILSRICKCRFTYMCFWGRAFKVLLLTDHLPLMSVSRRLTPARIKKGIAAAFHLRALAKSSAPPALLGLNPHAGEGGLLGKDEKKFAKVLRRGKLAGPLVPDTAFLPRNWKKYSVFICPYHDQGLIPFKLVHGFNEGVHLTLGLPFVRTSVDHGTAKELFGLDKAHHGSMRDAIELAMYLAGRLK